MAEIKPMSVAGIRRLMETPATRPPAREERIALGALRHLERLGIIQKRLMSSADTPEPLPTGPIANPEVRRVLLKLRETVAQATCEALLELRSLGVE